MTGQCCLSVDHEGRPGCSIPCDMHGMRAAVACADGGAGCAGRGVLEKARRPNKFDPKKAEAAGSSGGAACGSDGDAPDASGDAASDAVVAGGPFAGRAAAGARSPPLGGGDGGAFAAGSTGGSIDEPRPTASQSMPLMAEATVLGEVEKMPMDLDGGSGPLSGRPMGGAGPFPNNKLRASSWHMAKEAKQSKRNRCARGD